VSHQVKLGCALHQMPEFNAVKAVRDIEAFDVFVVVRGHSGGV